MRAQPRQLAERFAAKEATMKALACDERLPWHSIAVVTDINDAPTLALSGRAAEMAQARGVSSMALSFTHGASYAAAIVLTKGKLMDETIAADVRGVLRDHARLPVEIDSLDAGADLFQAGMSSHASVNVMLALKDRFDVEFPDAMLRRSVFETVAAITAAIAELRVAAA